MTKIELIAKFESKLRPYLMSLPGHFVVKLYSKEKLKFLNNYFKEEFNQIEINSPKIKAWGIDFNSSIFNAAGMFKNGYGYDVVAKQGAGAYLFGTTTNEVRNGNLKNDIYLPFAPYPNSNSASNWMGLPNLSHFEVAKNISKIHKIKNCPIGASVAITGDANSRENLNLLLDGINAYEKANVDFIELNESCPNVVGHEKEDTTKLDNDLINRLEYISKKFLENRNRNLPLILKLSNDTNPELITPMIDIMIDLKFDGLNLGNTSTEYQLLKHKIHQKDLKVYEYFTNTFGGGLSGKVLKEKSFNLLNIANKHLSQKNLKYEFNLIRTGGIENKDDLDLSLNNGATFCQWYTSYFSHFSKYGHNLYKELFK